MNNEPQNSQIKSSRLYVIFVLGSIFVSLLLVLVALSLYKTTGTAQLDLSRPGYAAIREKVNNDDRQFQGFESSGDLDKSALSEFDELYTQKLKQATEVDAYSGDVLSPKSMQIDQTSASGKK